MLMYDNNIVRTNTEINLKYGVHGEAVNRCVHGEGKEAAHKRG